MTYFITNAYALAMAAECVLIVAVCLRLIFALKRGAFAENFARTTASLALFIAAGLLIYTWPRHPGEILSRMLAHDTPAWGGKILVLVGALAALRATRSHEQPQLFFTAAIACFLVAANDLVVGGLALEALFLGALATTRARVLSGLYLLCMGAIVVQIGATDFGSLRTAHGVENLLLLLPPACAALGGILYLTRPQGRYVWFVLVGVSVFVGRYVIVVFLGAKVARRLLFLG